MNYTLHQLQIFIKVVETLSITKASEELYLTQPAVSIQLKNFQDQFEIPLTEVIGRSLHITDFGVEVYQVAKNILEEVDKINYMSQAYKGLQTGKIKFSVVSTGKYVMPFFLSGFVEKYNEIDIMMDVTNKAKVMEKLMNNESDFALVSLMPYNIHLEEEELLENKLYLIAKAGHPYKSKLYDKKFLSTIPLIYREEGSGTRYVLEKFLETLKSPTRKKLELSTNEAVKQSVLAGLGFSVMPIIGIRNELLNGDLEIIPVKGFPLKSKWRLVWLKDKKLSPASKVYLDFLRKEKQRIIKREFYWVNDF